MTVSPDHRIALRRAAVHDVRAIAEFQTRCWAEAYRGLVPQDYLDRMTVKERETRWRGRLIARNYRVMLAELAGALVGVASARRAHVIGAPALELKTLYVSAGQRGHGLAAALTDATIGTAPAHLWMFADNPRAGAFYAKQGFRPDGHRKVDPDTGLWEIRLVRE